MSNIYTSYVCKRCRKQLVLLTEEIESMIIDKYLTCAYCGSKHIVKQNATDSLKECMSEHSYRRSGGVIKQTR